MSPTRRDILKASAGLVASSLVSVPAVAQPEPQPEPVYIESVRTLALTANLSDGRRVTIGQMHFPDDDDKIGTIVTISDGKGGSITHPLDVDIAEPIHWANTRFMAAALQNVGVKVLL